MPMSYLVLFFQKIIGNVHDDVRQKINDITTAINEHLTQVYIYDIVGFKPL